MFKVHQVTLNDFDAIIIEAHGWKEAGNFSDKVKAYTLGAMKGDHQTSFSLGHHKHVSTIEANDLNAVFDIGNIGPEELITRHAPMHSVSLGDVIETPDGEFFAVASMGFTKLEV